MALPPQFLQALRAQVGDAAEYPADATPSLLGAEPLSFDFVVVGGGAAGAAVAARLAAHSPTWSVLVLEAGGDVPLEAEIPGLWFRLWQDDLLWTYHSQPRDDAFQGLRGRCTTMIRGRVLGGTSTINGMPYLRGHPQDYDSWGIDGWKFKDVLPFFKLSEGMRDEGCLAGQPDLHGVAGGLTVEAARAAGPGVDPLKAVIKEAALELGLQRLDDLSGPGPGPLGYGDVPRTQRDGLRCGSAKAFLSKAATGGATNLKLARRCVATRLRFSEGRATAVEARADGRPVLVHVKKEVILCAGAMETPKLLLLSGVGPKEDLTALGVPVVLDAAVGAELQDHALFPGIVFTVPPQPKADADQPDPLTAFLTQRRGPLSSVGLIELMGFTRTESTSDWAVPSVQFNHVRYPKGTFQCKPFATHIEQAVKAINADSDILVVMPFLLHPGRPGRLTLRSDDPADPPHYESGLLLDQRDVDILLESIRFVEKMAKTKSFQEAGVTLRYVPFLGEDGEDGEDVVPGSDAYWVRAVRLLAGSAFHPVATCALGKVLDARLQLPGLKGLRVADASALPGPVSANPNAPAIMVGERAAHFIIEDHSPSPSPA